MAQTTFPPVQPNANFERLFGRSAVLIGEFLVSLVRRNKRDGMILMGQWRAKIAIIPSPNSLLTVPS